jgi:hypothetical protein
MKKLLLIFALMLCAVLSNAQNSISGTIIDPQGAPLPGVNVLLLSVGDSSLVKGSITEATGIFHLDKISTGNYLLVCRYVGYRTSYKSVYIDQSIQLPTDTLQEAAMELNEAVVVGEKPLFEQKIDRLVVNVQGSATSAGGTALEVLERSPGVQVNRVNNSLMMNGKNEVLVMINGKVSRQSVTSLMQMLGSMSASNIEKIELITDPSAKYEAGSNGGIINIQFIENPELGTNGAMTVSAGYGKHEKAGAGINLNKRTQRMNIYSDFSYNRDHTYQYVINHRDVTGASESTTSSTINDRDPVSTNFNGRAGIDYKLSEATDIGGFVSGYSNLWDMTAENSALYESTTSPAYTIDVLNHEKGRLKHIMGNMNLAHRMASNGMVSFNFDYLYYGDNNKTDYENTYRQEGNEEYEYIETSKATPMNIFVGSVDYSRDFGKKVRFESGVKGISSRLKNDVEMRRFTDGTVVIDEDFTENAKLDEKISAGYTSMAFTIDDKTSLTTGLRYEYSETNLKVQGKGSVVDFTYSKLFPSASINRKLGRDASVQLSYGRRISRPSFSDLAPFFIFLDPSTYFRGNTALRPAINDNFKAGITVKKYMAAVEFTHESNAIARYQPVLVPETSHQMFTSLNLRYRNTLSVMFTVPLEITSSWTANLNVLGVNRQLKTLEETKAQLSYYNINLSQNFTLPAGYTLEMTGFYNSESIDGVSKLGAFYNLNLGAKKRFGNDSQLSFSVNNMFKFQNNVYTVQEFADGYSTDTIYKFETWKFRVSYLYKFGNRKLKGRGARATGSEEIQNRIN